MRSLVPPASFNRFPVFDMTHPVLWPKKTFFYPIGNTPPICLTQSLSPDKSAEILLLGCGDPRSILYTVYADLARGNRKLDFTCCDGEPAVLARNILLLTMIVDGIATNTTWSIFFHFFLDKTSHEILIAQCRTLIDSSSDIKTWKGSKYGSFLRFCDEGSLVEIRRHWTLYADSLALSDNERKALRASFHFGMQLVRESLSGNTRIAGRATDPLFLHILEVIDQVFKLFWTTGVTTSKSSQSIHTPYINPTFVYSLSGNKFNVHYGTNPIMAFDMAPALASRKTRKQPASITTKDLVECAKSQFSAWSSSFKKRLSSGSMANIVIRFFVGEPLAFCQALHVSKEQKTTETGIQAQPWGGSPIMFDAGDYSCSSPMPAPLLFNVIESFDLADHVGLLNLIVVTVPLLDEKPWSIIYTKTSIPSGPLSSAKSRLNDNACGDIPTLSMLLGVAPSPHLWHFTTYSNPHEDTASGQLFENISWHFVSFFIPNAISKPQDTSSGRFKLVCDAQKLSQFFFAFYLQMFATENHMSNFRNIGTANLNKQNNVHYIRESFVAFLALVKERVKVDWGKTMDHLVDLIASDRRLRMGLNNYQDLIYHMYARNVHVLTSFSSAFMKVVRTPKDRFHGWKDVPPVVCIVLKVPRHQLKYLEDMDVDEIGTPILQCETYSDNSRLHNVHSSIHFTFGDTVASVIDGETRVIIKEDPKGWSGSSPLIVTFYLASQILSNDPAGCQVGLHIHSTPATSRLTARLGMYLTIFSTPLADTTHVQVARHRPNNPQEIKLRRNTPGYSPLSVSDNTREVMMKFDPSGEKATSLIVRKDTTDPNATNSLASGTKVSTTPIAESTVLVTFGDYAHQFNYPFPIQMKHLQTRIARKSSYIEVESLIRTDFSDSHDLSLNPFPVAHDDCQVNLLNVHYLNLDILPVLSVPKKENDPRWLSIHSGAVFYSAERGALVNLKESIANMLLLNTAGLQVGNLKSQPHIFGLTDSRNGGVYTLIFVNAIKLDLASRTFVVDACIVPLVDDIMLKLAPALPALRNHDFTSIITLADETRAWKLLLPTLSERCRTWNHTDTCEYRTRGVPASLEGSNYSPLCSCGKGKNLGRFGMVSEWKLFHEEATRVAIGPLFAFSFTSQKKSRIRNTMRTAFFGCLFILIGMVCCYYLFICFYDAVSSTLYLPYRVSFWIS